MQSRKEYLKIIDEVIASGPYQDDWASLSAFTPPGWFTRGKFGIFIHWGAYSVPAYGDEWYPRHMYDKDRPEYEHHIKNWGAHKEFAYEDFIPLFKGEKFDPVAWVDLIKESGARYVMPVGEHHDGFQMYDSDLSDWCAAKMGPKRDVLGLLKREIEAAGMEFCTSSHRAENYWYFSEVREGDTGLKDIEYQEPYGWAHKYFEPKDQDYVTHVIHSESPSKEHLDEWLVRTCELVDKYEPSALYFDWWITHAAFKPYLKRFAAYYYNRAAGWGREVSIYYKEDAFMEGTAVYDIERGQFEGIRSRAWQTDTAVAKNSWGYTENNDFKTPESLVEDLVDIVSKNGSMLLNIGPKADGTISDEDRAILKSIGAWLRVNGEGIYNTEYWTTFGEGPTNVKTGYFTDNEHPEYTAGDFRFTFRAPYLYAFCMGCPRSSGIEITSLARRNKAFYSDVKGVEVLGFDNCITFKRDDESLKITWEGDIESSFPVGFRILLD